MPAASQLAARSPCHATVMDPLGENSTVLKRAAAADPGAAPNAPAASTAKTARARILHRSCASAQALSSGRDAQTAVGLGQAADPLLDLVGRDPGVREPQRVETATEVGSLHEDHSTLAGGAREGVHVGALREVHPQEVAALRGRVARVG